MIPEKWKLSSLGDGIKLLSGQHILSNLYTEEPTGVPYITGPADFLNGRVKPTKYTKSPKVCCQEGDILLVVKGSGTGKVVRSNGVYCISRQLMAIRPTKLHDNFLFQILKNKESEYEGSASGLIPGISRDDVLNTQILIPPFQEQHKIAQILSSWDKAIELTEKLTSAKEQQKKALMQKLISDRLRFGEDINTDWKLLPLSKCVIPVSREVQKPRASFLALGIRSHGKGTFLKPDFDSSKISMEILYKVKKDDLIVNITFAWEGAIAIVREQDDGALVSHRFPTFEFKRDILLPEFFKYYILQKRFIYELGIISPGGAGRNRVLDKEDFMRLKVKVPPISEQKKIGSVLSACDKEIGLLKKKLRLLKEQKKALMQKLLTGKIRVKV